MPFSSAELEVLCLRAATSSLDEVLNKALFDVTGPAAEAELSFHSSTHQRLFNIHLVDMISPMDANLTALSGSALHGLHLVCTVPQFNHTATVEFLRSPLDALSKWLEQHVTYPVYLSHLSSEVQLEIERREYIEICGNISKHNFTRLTRTAAKLRRILSRNKIELGDLEDVQILEDFYRRFHEDMLNYHATTLGELLNNVRWGIHRYLKPEFDRSFTPPKGGSVLYIYKYPTDVTHPIARTWYCDLMDDVRNGPYIQPFQGSKWLKLRP